MTVKFAYGEKARQVVFWALIAGMQWDIFGLLTIHKHDSNQHH